MTESESKDLRSIICIFIQLLRNNGIYLNIESKHIYSEILFLEKYYNTGDANGYEGALYDYDVAGISSILENICENLKHSEQKKYIDIIVEISFNSLCWEERKAILNKIMHTHSEYLSDDLRNIKPALLVPHIKEIIELIRSANGITSKILNRSKYETI